MAFRESDDPIMDQKRQQSFFHWNKDLSQACMKGQYIIRGPIYHGISSNLIPNSFTAKYCGPLSTTDQLRVAISFAGKHGKILMLSLVFNYRALKVHWLSDYPDEGEILLYDRTLLIDMVLDADVPMTDEQEIEQKNFFITLKSMNRQMKVVGMMYLLCMYLSVVVYYSSISI